MKILDLTPIHFHSEFKSTAGLEKTKPDFSMWLKEQVKESNERMLSADRALIQLASGQAVSLHQTMLKLEQAKLSLQFLEQIRNRFMSAYQELLREQI